MGGGGKSRETTSTVELPPGLEQGANEVLAAGLKAAALPYSPNRGVTVAAFTPQQTAAMRASNMLSASLGLPSVNPNGPLGDFGIAGGGVKDEASGIWGYSTGDLYDANVEASMTPEELAEREELRLSYGRAADRVYDAAGIDPMSSVAGMGGNDGGPMLDEDDEEDYDNEERGERNTSGGGGSSKWDGPRDMIDGGGPGKSGGKFSGGGRVSAVANAVTGRK